MQHPALNPHDSPENSSEQGLKPNLFFCHILSYFIPALSLPQNSILPSRILEFHSILAEYPSDYLY